MPPRVNGLTRELDATGRGDVTRVRMALGQGLGRSEKACELMKKRVLTSSGDELGTVKDIDFDTETGALTTFLLDGAPDVAADRLIAVGSYAVVVRAEPHGS